MNCQSCNKTVQRIGPVVLPHLCKDVITPQRFTRSVESLITPASETYGVGPDFAPTVYGEYYATSPLIYSAIRLRANALSRPPLKIYRRLSDTSSKEVEKSHPLSLLLHKVNPFWTERDLRFATSVHLDLWGSAFWIVQRTNSLVPTDIWLYRPDRMTVLGDPDTYVKGFRFRQDRGPDKVFTPNEVVWFRHFNPLSEALNVLDSAENEWSMGLIGSRVFLLDTSLEFFDLFVSDCVLGYDASV